MPAFDYQGKSYNNPVELALDLIGGKWKMPILWRLRQRTWRYSELKRDLGRITHKMLTQQLRELEESRLVTRTVHAVVPPRVDYEITDFGRSSIPVIEQLRAWGESARKRRPAPPATRSVVESARPVRARRKTP